MSPYSPPFKKTELRTSTLQDYCELLLHRSSWCVIDACCALS